MKIMGLHGSEVGGSCGLPGGRGFGDRGNTIFETHTQVASLTAPSSQARWPDLQATASAADPFQFVLHEIASCCGVTVL